MAKISRFADLNETEQAQLDALRTKLSLSADDAGLLGHYSLDRPWVFDATSILTRVHALADRGLLVAANPEGHGYLLTEAGAAALAAYNKAGTPA
jgi:hypothetical protein